MWSGRSNRRIDPPTDHNWVLKRVDQRTCEWPGATYYYCSTCLVMKAEDYIEPLGHNYDENGVCVNCVTNEQNSTNGLSAQDELIIYLVIIAVIVVVALCVVLWNKLRKKK